MRISSGIDLGIVIPALVLLVFGNVILSSVYPQAFPQQFLFLAIAILAYFVFSKTDVFALKNFAVPLYVFSLILLFVTFLFGSISHGAIRWIQIGSFSLQPSELVKPFLVLFFAWVLSRTGNLKRFFVSFILLLPGLLLVMLQPDLGSGLVLFAGWLGAAFTAGIPLLLVISGFVFTALGLPVFWRFLEEYQKQRILTFLNPQADPLGRGYNAIQSIIAVGSGGLWGRGLREGTQAQLAFLPERQTDFIFAAASEELGFLGSLVIIIAFFFLFLRLIIIIKESESGFSQYLVGGIFLMLFSQTIINIGMNIGLFPITGIPLPLISSGGSSLLSMAMALGMVSSVARSSLSKGISLGIMPGWKAG